MRPWPRWLILLGVALGLVAIGAWSLLEARAQRREVARIVASEADVLGRSLGIALAGADAATLEIDELLRWKLLDDARAFAALARGSGDARGQIAGLAEEAGLDAVLLVDPGCAAVDEVYGTLSAPERRAVIGELEPLCRGEADTLIRGDGLPAGDGTATHLLAAVRDERGGIVAVRAHRGQVQAFAALTGVPRLLEALVGSGDVVYLVFEEQGVASYSATWDGGPAPPPATRSPGPVSVRGRRVIEARAPVVVPAGRSAVVRVGIDATRIERITRRTLMRSLLAGLGLALAGLAALGFAGVQRARAIERQQAARRLAEAEAARRRSERLAAAGALSAGLAHEVRSPLNAIALAAQRLRRRPAGGEECVRFAERIEAEVRRLDEALHGFLELARPVSGERRPVSLRALAEDVAGLVSSEAEPQEVAIDVTGREIVVPADESALRRAMLNVVRNAVQASPRGGRVGIEIDADDRVARICVRDEGPGFGEELIGRAFDAFVTTRAGGTGLGLALARRVLEEHGGEILAVDREPRGAEVTLVMPLAGEPDR